MKKNIYKALIYYLLQNIKKQKKTKIFTKNKKNVTHLKQINYLRLQYFVQIYSE